MRTHPLDNEDLEVIVILRHPPTACSVTVALTAPADDDSTAMDTIDEAAGNALDQLLDAIESR